VDPFIVTPSGDLEQVTHQGNVKLVLVVENHFEPPFTQFVGVAK